MTHFQRWAQRLGSPWPFKDGQGKHVYEGAVATGVCQHHPGDKGLNSLHVSVERELGSQWALEPTTGKAYSSLRTLLGGQ